MSIEEASPIYTMIAEALKDAMKSRRHQVKKAPIDAYPLQLRGTSGSGKTTAMKKLIDVIGAKPVR